LTGGRIIRRAVVGRAVGRAALKRASDAALGSRDAGRRRDRSLLPLSKGRIAVGSAPLRPALTTLRRPYVAVGRAAHHAHRAFVVVARARDHAAGRVWGLHYSAG